MDQQMDALWWQAQRRIDYALAGMCACALWMVVLPLFVLLTPMRWSGLFLLGLLSCLPIGLVFLRPLDSGRRVVRAIGQRDAEEVARWRGNATPPAYAELVRRRVWARRPRLPMLCVVASMAAFVAVLAFIRRAAPDYPAMAQYSLGIAVASMGVCLSAVVQMFRGRLGNRTLLAGHILVIWLVPLGVGIASMAMITGRQDIAAAVAVRTMTAMVYVIFGLVGVLVTVVMAALWFALVTVLVQPTFDGRGILPARAAHGAGAGAAVEPGSGGNDEDDAGRPGKAGDGDGAGSAGFADGGGDWSDGAQDGPGRPHERGGEGSSGGAGGERMSDCFGGEGSSGGPGGSGAAGGSGDPGTRGGSSGSGDFGGGSGGPREAPGPGGQAARSSARNDFLSLLEAGVNVDDLLDAQASSEFDEADVTAVREELAVQRSDYVIAGVIVGATAAIVALASAGLSGTPPHVVVGVVLAAAVSMQLHRMIL